MKTYNIIILLVLFAFGSCKELKYDIDETYEKADITAISVYNGNNETVLVEVNAIQIDTEAGTVTATVKADADITKLKVTLTLSRGAKISPSLSVGLQDFTQPKTYTVTSPNETVTKNWTITITQ